MQDNFSIAVALDANEHMKLGHIDRIFRSLGLIDTITSITSDYPTGSHVRRSQQVDGIWVSVDLIVKSS